MNYQPPPNGFRTFLIVWFTQSISVFGSALTFFALTIWLTQVLYARPEQKPELAAALAAISLAFAVPTILVTPFAGAWADRHDRKRTMIAMDFTNGCLIFVVTALMIANALPFWLLLAIMVLFAIVGTFHNAAFDTSVAMLVPEEQLARANGMMQTIWSLSGILAPGIAALIIALPALGRQGVLPDVVGAPLAQLGNGAPLAMAIDTITFFFASAALIFLYIPSPRRTDLGATSGKPQPSIWADMKEGALYIWHRRPLLWLLGSFAVINFVTAPLGVFQPLLVKFNLAADWSAQGFTLETALAVLATVASVGGLIGGFLISTWGGLKKRRVYGIIVPMMLAGIALMILGLSPFLFLTAAMGFLLEGMTPVMNAHSQAIWQTQTPRELQGRVFSVRRVIAQFTWPLSTALAGLAGGLFNPGMVMAVLGGILIVFCIGQLFNPYLLRVEDKAWLDELAVSRGGSAPVTVTPAAATAEPASLEQVSQ
jgi:MFS family permease